MKIENSSSDDEFELKDYDNNNYFFKKHSEKVSEKMNLELLEQKHSLLCFLMGAFCFLPGIGCIAFPILLCCYFDVISKKRKTKEKIIQYSMDIDLQVALTVNSVNNL